MILMISVLIDIVALVSFVLAGAFTVNTQWVAALTGIQLVYPFTAKPNSIKRFNKEVDQ